MTATLTGYPSQPQANGAIAPLELGELVIRAEPNAIRALGEHLLQAARELEAGVSQVEAFAFPDAESPRNTPSKVLVFGVKRHGA